MLKEATQQSNSNSLAGGRVQPKQTLPFRLQHKVANAWRQFYLLIFLAA